MNTRQAIEQISELADGIAYGESEANALAILDICAEVLNKPLRNCDVGNAEEQSVRFRNMCNKYYDDENPCNKKCPMTAFDIMHGWPRCQSYWGQMPFKADDCEKTEEEV